MVGWIYRLWALGGWGNKTGSGGAWPVRFASQVLALPTSLIAGDGLLVVALCLVVAVGLLVAWRAQWRRGVRAGRAARALAVTLVIAALAWWKSLGFLPESAPFENFARITMLPVWREALLLTFMLAGFALTWKLWQRGERAMLFGWLWVLVGFLPLIVQPPTSPHVHYPIAPGWSLWLACFAVWAWNAAARRLPAARAATGTPECAA